jgi:putative FmdB family regulatory protein
MPTYGFICSQCEKDFEVFRPMSEYEKPADCPSCGKSAKKVYARSGPPIVKDGTPRYHKQ